MSAALSSLALYFIVFAAPSAALSRQHFDRARHLFAQRDYRRALDEFTAAAESAPAELPDLWFDIGQCHRNLGHPRQAVAAFARYLALAPDAADRAKVQALLTQMGGRSEDLGDTSPPSEPAPAAAPAAAPEPPPAADATSVEATAPAPQVSATGAEATAPNNVTPVADPRLVATAPPPRAPSRRWVVWTAAAGAVGLVAVTLGLGLGLGLAHGSPALGSAGTFDTRGR